MCADAFKSAANALRGSIFMPYLMTAAELFSQGESAVHVRILAAAGFNVAVEAAINLCFVYVRKKLQPSPVQLQPLPPLQTLQQPSPATPPQPLPPQSEASSSSGRQGLKNRSRRGSPVHLDLERQ